MFVLRFRGECPELMTEPFYDEVVTVRNGIALVEKEYNKDGMLLGREGYPGAYEYIGEIKEEKELKELLAHQADSDLALTIQNKVMNIEELDELVAAKDARVAARTAPVKPLINSL
jgi:hypothetical protein